MNLNKIILDKISNFTLLSREFDNNYLNIIKIIDTQINDESKKNIFMVTKNYIELRSIHGELIMLIDDFKNLIKQKKKTDENTNNFYDLSTFNSILTTINELITNIDFQYKKIAVKYPNFITKKPLIILLFTDDDSENNDFVKLLNNVKDQVQENIYKVIKCEKNIKKFKCDNIIGIKLTLKITSLPLLYIINDKNIIEIPIDKINNTDALKNLIK
jgi:hypothetical protein